MNELDDGDKLLLTRAMKDLDKANAVMRFLSDHFRDKYNLTPENQVMPNGTIITLEAISPIQSTGNNENGNSLSDMRSSLAMFSNTGASET